MKKDVRWKMTKEQPDHYTVKDLIERLQELPYDLPVISYGAGAASTGDPYPFIQIRPEDVNIVDARPDPKEYGCCEKWFSLEAPQTMKAVCIGEGAYMFSGCPSGKD